MISVSRQIRLSTQTLTQPPYQVLAEIYDHVMTHVDYPRWARYVHDLIQQCATHTRAVVDLACGTGSLALELDELGYEMTGADLSEAMLRVGKKKVGAAGKTIPFLHRDLRRLNNMGPFDAAICMYDSINYIMDAAGIECGLRNVYDILHPESLFIFDVCTEQNSLRYFSDLRDAGQGPGYTYDRTSRYDRESRLQFNNFAIRFSGGDVVWRESHTQRIYPLDEIESQIRSSAFDLLNVYSGFTFKRGSEQSDRVHFVLRRPAR